MRLEIDLNGFLINDAISFVEKSIVEEFLKNDCIEITIILDNSIDMKKTIIDSVLHFNTINYKIEELNDNTIILRKL